ncbi:MAG: hypothetical protein M1818_007496 [Claussenomyces sp. TS43310]|nr:MAG: hypothetical protein M1818_007496 [Claussenomyces sp. TS43310]
MSTPATLPTLTPQFCFSTTALQALPTTSDPESEANPQLLSGPAADFLRLSRTSIDDSITANLNALLTPSRTPFDPGSTSVRAAPRRRDAISPESCSAFKAQVLFPNWKARGQVLAYCTSVAAAPEPREEVPGADELDESLHVMDNRADPYSTRPVIRESRVSRLADVCRMEGVVEDIVRTRTWGVIKARCGDADERWEDALAKWQREKS